MKTRIIVSKFNLVAFAAAAVIAASCSSMSADRDFKLASFSAPGCSHTKAPSDEYIIEKAQAGILHLQSKSGNLKITLSGLSDNCSIKGGFDCQATLKGSIIYVNVAARSELSANCICAVEDIVTELSGLEKGGYTLIYNYQSSSEDITQEVEFEFSALLNMIVDFERTIMYPKTEE